jgi:hypothetical protein
MKTILLLVFLLFTLSYCKQFNAQSIISNSITIEKSISSYLIDGTEIVSAFLTVSNNCSEPVLLWFEYVEPSEKNDSINIARQFFEKRNESDCSLLQIGMDYNIDSFTPDIFDGFIKRLLPKDTFYIQILLSRDFTDLTIHEATKLLESSIVNYTQSYVFNFIPSIDNFNPIVFYNPDVITLKEEFFLNLRR